MRMKSKQQLKDESIERFKITVEATRKDIRSLDEKINELNELQINEATAEVINVLEGIRRDLCYGKDNVKRIRRVLNAKT